MILRQLSFTRHYVVLLLTVNIDNYLVWFGKKVYYEIGKEYYIISRS